MIHAKAPAKLNLFLHITGRRKDGYHLLQTLFQFVDFYDELSFALGDSPDITLNPAITGIQPEDNLVIKAAHKLQQATGCRLGARIELLKRLPMGGGLGGGSSNAATTLVALNKLWQTGLSTEQLQTIGLSLGADVPIFIYGHAALATGVGEQLETASIPEPWYLIAHPNCHASTKELFQEKQLTRDSKLIRIRDFLEGQQGHNDFEPILRQRFPLIDRCMALMDTESKASVTGSGACLFSAFASEHEATKCRQQLNAKLHNFGIGDTEVRWIIAKGLNRSPLYSGSLAN